MKIEDYLNTLPESILSGQNIQLSKQSFREIFKFARLDKDHIFYHLGCGDGRHFPLFEQSGLKGYGTEISDEICRILKTFDLQMKTYEIS